MENLRPGCSLHKKHSFVRAVLTLMSDSLLGSKSWPMIAYSYSIASYLPSYLTKNLELR